MSDNTSCDPVLRGKDIDPEALSRLLSEIAVDIRSESAFVHHFTLDMDAKSEDILQYNVSLTLSASDKAEFNKIFSELMA